MKEKISVISVFVNLILAIGKTVVGVIGNSAAVLAEGIHSGMDVLSSLISLAGIKISKKPVDEKHPYGHYKFEVVSGLAITLLLFVAGIWMIYEAYRGFVNPSLVSVNYFAFGVMFVSVVLNEIMARFKIYYGKKENSLSLLSDGVHDRVDVYASVAVLIGVVLMPYWIYVDSILAFLIGLYIVKKSFELGREATDSLLDVSAGSEIEDEIKLIVGRHKVEMGELKTQRRGAVVTANFEIELDKNIRVDEATKISELLKRDLIDSIESLEYVVIQIKNHEITDVLFEPKDVDSKISYGKGFAWHKKGRFEGKLNKADGKGPEGFCVCSKCGYKQVHEKGKPCSKIKCPKCGGVFGRGL